jgi:hypothetical protein
MDQAFSRLPSHSSPRFDTSPDPVGFVVVKVVVFLRVGLL